MAEYFFDEEEESNEDIDVKNDLLNYKGYFVENEEEEEKKFYEFGAHFPYMYLYQRLEMIVQEREEKLKELERKLKEKEKGREREKESRDEQGTKEESKQNENLKDLLNVYQQKGKSRNRGEVDIGLTYMPKMNKKNNNKLNNIENIAINLIKSTANKKKDQEKIRINRNEEKRNNITNSNLKLKEKLKDKVNIKGNSKCNKQQRKIRKRNLNQEFINDSLNSAIVSLNMDNKSKFKDKINPKKMTHDIPYVKKIQNNLVNKLKSIQYSKEKLRKQIINSGSIEQRLNKRITINIALKKRRNSNNKWYNSKCYGYQNTKNAISSKNVMKKGYDQKQLINQTGISSAHQKEKNYFTNSNKNKSNINTNINSKINILNKNKKLIKDVQNIKKNNHLILVNSNKNYSISNQGKIPNNNKKIIHSRPIVKQASSTQKNMEFIEGIGVKKNKNIISRNKNAPLYNNQSQNVTNKNFNSVASAMNRKQVKNNNNNPSNINYTNNYGNLTQQMQPQNANRQKPNNFVYNKISISNTNLKNYQPTSFHKKATEGNSNKNKNSKMIKTKINIANIKDNIKNYLNKDVKIAINLNEKNNSKNLSLNQNKNNYFMKGNNSNKNTSKKNGHNNNISSGKNLKNIISRNKMENNHNIYKGEKLTGKANKTMTQNKKKHHININININNQHNIILNKMNSALNNNSLSLGSVRSTEKKGESLLKKEKIKI